MTQPEPPDVTDNTDSGQYEAWIGGQLAGFARYQREPGVVTFFHTEVDPAYEGRGVGGALVRTALDASRAAGEPVRPTCPFFAGWIERHPDYQDLVHHDS